ncbi:MAG: GtrA family protein [Clostridia bacterium]|nr:GtrA family protein [Clostridia bacterium]
MQKFLDTILNRLDRILPVKLMEYVRHFLNVQFLLFVIIGFINTFNTTVIATLLDMVISVSSTVSQVVQKYNITFVAAYILSMVISFFLNTFITFKEKPTWRKFIVFPISYIPNFLIQYICVWIFRHLNLNSTLAYAIAAVIGIPITFLTMKFLVYKKRTDSNLSKNTD